MEYWFLKGFFLFMINIHFHVKRNFANESCKISPSEIYSVPLHRNKPLPHFPKTHCSTNPLFQYSSCERSELSSNLAPTSYFVQAKQGQAQTISVCGHFLRVDRYGKDRQSRGV